VRFGILDDRGNSKEGKRAASEKNFGSPGYKNRHGHPWNAKKEIRKKEKA